MGVCRPSSCCPACGSSHRKQRPQLGAGCRGSVGGGRGIPSATRTGALLGRLVGSGSAEQRVSGISTVVSDAFVCVCVCTPCACMSLCTSGLAASGQVSCQGHSRTPPAAEQNPCAKHTWWQCLEERSPLGLSPRPGGGDWPRTAAASQGCLGPERERGSRCAENTAKGFGICLRPQLTGDFLPGSRGREHAHHRRPQPPPLPLSPPTGGLPSSTHTLR